MVSAVGMEMGAEDAAVAVSFLQPQHHRPCPVAKQHASGAVGPVDDARKRLGPDDQRGFRLAKPDEVVDVNGVKVAGFSNLPARLAADSSSLLAKNLVSFLPLITGENGEFAPNFDDEIVAAMTLTRDGETVHATLKEG